MVESTAHRNRLFKPFAGPSGTASSRVHSSSLSTVKLTKFTIVFVNFTVNSCTDTSHPGCHYRSSATSPTSLLAASSFVSVASRAAVALCSRDSIGTWRDPSAIVNDSNSRLIFLTSWGVRRTEHLRSIDPPRYISYISIRHGSTEPTSWVHSASLFNNKARSLIFRTSTDGTSSY